MKDYSSRRDNMSNNNDRELLYQLDGKPPFSAAYPMGLQHVLAMFAGNLAPIFIIASTLGLSDASKTLMIQCAMFASGITTLVQLYPIKIGKLQIGGRLPIVMGTSFAFLGTAIAVGMMGLDTGLTPEMAMSLVLMGAIGGSISEILLGSLYKYVKKVFTPLLVGSVLLAIGIGLLSVGVDYFAGGNGAADYGSANNLILGFFTLAVVIGCQVFGKGVIKSAAILIGMVAGYILAIPMGMVDFAPISQAGIFSFPKPYVFNDGFGIVTNGALVLKAVSMFIVVYLISGIETIGNTSGITVAAFDRKATAEETSGALLADAGGSMFAGIFGSLPNTAFGQNAGLVAMTKVINRWAIALGAFTLIAASFIPKLGAIFSSIPNAVLGGGVITVFAMIMMNGLKLISKAGFEGKNSIIFALTFGVGYGLGGNEAAIAGLPSWLHWIFAEQTASVFIVCLLATVILDYKNILSNDDSE